VSELTLLSTLKGVGPQTLEKLARLHIFTLIDLVLHLPLRYQDRTRITPIARAVSGDSVVVEVTVIKSTVNYRVKRPILQAQVQDASGSLQLTWFYFNAQQVQQMQLGVRLRCFGEIRDTKIGRSMTHPEYQIVHEGQPLVLTETLTPIYPTTAGLSQFTLRKVMKQCLQLLSQPQFCIDYLQPQLAPDFPDLLVALQRLHFPPPDVAIAPLLEGTDIHQQRLALEELIAQQLAMLRFKSTIRAGHAPALTHDGGLIQRFLQQLPYQLTKAQARVVDEIATDLCQTTPMMRLVQGDVGSGKTAVAALAALQAIAAGYQVALMAPTELLAQQHFQVFQTWFEPLGLSVVNLWGKLTAKQRRCTLSELVEGRAHVAIGTHALFQEEVQFNRLGLIIIDEQHRFGVAQRLALLAKGISEGSQPHQLILTATPIPRTLAMTNYADLDVSIIDELPPGRTPVQTVVIAESRREEIIERIQTTLDQGRQVYWVCPLIEESEVLECETAENTQLLLQAALPNARIGLAHGRLKAAAKLEVMQQFKQGELQILVATTVIEVGVDVPNASVMIIENAERLGLAQLHQLRGRVGRGSAQSFCVLLYKYPLSQLARERLAVMRETTDGFIIAEKDLALRGPGEWLGTRQTGLAALRMADPVRDAELIPRAQQIAINLLAEESVAVAPLIQRWLPAGESYGAV